MEAKKIYLEDGASFTFVHGAAVTLFKTADISRVNIDWGSTIDLAGGKSDPASKQAALVGEFTDVTDVVRDVYVEPGEQPGEVKFYYYDEQVEKKDAPHRTYLKEGTTYNVMWKIGFDSSLAVPRLDIDEEATLSDENLAHTEVGNDGMSVGKLHYDTTSVDVFIDHGDVASRLYCYLP